MTDLSLTGLLNKITRVEVIDEEGRVYVKNRCLKAEVQLQDEQRTLKIFITNLPKDIDNEHSGKMWIKVGENRYVLGSVHNKENKLEDTINSEEKDSV